MLTLYGHAFSFYTWKALIAFYANGTPFEFRQLGAGNEADDAFVASAGPSGQFPVLRDGDATVFEASSIIEHLHTYYPGSAMLLPADRAEAVRVRMWDRVFDLHVMNVMQQAVAMKLRDPDSDHQSARDAVRAPLLGSYRWIEGWLASYAPASPVTARSCPVR